MTTTAIAGWTGPARVPLLLRLMPAVANSHPGGTASHPVANVPTGRAALRDRSGAVAGCAAPVKPDGFTVPATVSSPMEEQMRLSLKRNLVGLLALAGASLGLTASVAFADCYLVWVCIGNWCGWILVCI